MNTVFLNMLLETLAMCDRIITQVAKICSTRAEESILKIKELETINIIERVSHSCIFLFKSKKFLKALSWFALRPNI